MKIIIIIRLLLLLYYYWEEDQEENNRDGQKWYFSVLTDDLSPSFSTGMITFSFSYGYWILGYSYEDYEQLVRKLEVVLVETGPKSRL